MAQFHDAPAEYLQLMRAALPLYDRLQDELVRACAGVAARHVLDLGAGTGETSRRLLEAQPRARVVAVDGSRQMLDIAAGVLGTRARLRLARLEDPLPNGPFELVVSALAIHHLDGPGKADLFRRITRVLAPGGRFVMADVVVADGAVRRPTPLDPTHDRPDPLDDQLDWLEEAGFAAAVRWAEEDLVVVAAD